MNSRSKNIVYSFIAVAMLAVPGVFAQDPPGTIDKDITVIGQYTPTLSDALKINLMPAITDSFKRELPTSYTISPSALLPDKFELRKIKPAKLLPEKVEKLYKSYMMLGLGNYLSPLVKVNTASLRTNKYAYAAYLDHHSSFGKVKLANDKKVFAGFSDSKVGARGEKYFRNFTLAGNTFISSNTVHNYGYRPSIDTVLDKEDIKQRLLMAGIDAAINSTYKDSSHLNYHVGTGYNYFMDLPGNSEHAININSRLSKKFKTLDGGLKADILYFGKSGGIDSASNTIVSLNPSVSMNNKEWRFKAGVNLSFDIAHKVLMDYYPDIQFQFRAADKYLIPFVGLGGHLEANNYSKILQENPFTRPGLHVQNTSHKLKVYGGLKSYITPELSVYANASYSIIENQYFYVNDYSDSLGNYFSVVYDDIELLKLEGEIKYDASNKLAFRLQGQYSKPYLENIDGYWHRPLYDMSLYADYNLKNKILLYIGVNLVGQREVPTVAGNDVDELDPYLDFSLGMEYRYTKVLSAFMRLNNFTASKYQIWNQYPAQRFNTMLGFTYAL